jgi:hypothetical protein
VKDRIFQAILDGELTLAVTNEDQDDGTCWVQIFHGDTQIAAVAQTDDNLAGVLFDLVDHPRLF